MSHAANPEALNTLKEICAYLQKSEKTVRLLIKTEALPAAKIGGTWSSGKTAIDKWRSERLAAASTGRP